MQENPTTPLPVNEIPEDAPARPVVLPTQIWGVLVLVAFVIGLGSGYLIWAKPQEARAAAAEQRVIDVQATADAASAAAPVDSQEGAQVQVPEQVKRYDVPIDDDPILGSQNAPITIIEFSDYECPYCQRWHNEAWPKIKAKYGDKVRLVFRDYPLDTIHPNAIPAAEAANCAGDQDRYWEFNELLFSGAKRFSAETFEGYAQEVGLDLKAFQQCVASRKYRDEVEADMIYANELGVRSTPTFFVNGLAVVGAQPFEVFEQIIDLELAGKIPK